MEVVQKKTVWLWRLGRLVGQVPVAFEKCRCGARKSRRGVRSSEAHRAEFPGRCRCAAGDAVKASRRWAAYSVAMLLVTVPCSMLALYQRRTRSTRSSSETDGIVSSCDVFIVTLTGSTAVLQAWLARHHICVFVDQLHQVDSLLRAPPPRVPHLLLAWVVGVVALGLMDISYAHESAGAVYALLYVPNMFNYFLTYVMEALFADDAYCIFARFRTLNARLEAILQPAHERLSGRALTLKKCGIPPDKKRRGVAGAEGHSAGAARTPAEQHAWRCTGRGSGSCPAHVATQRLEDAHALLCESSRNVSRRYGATLLVDVLNLLLHFVVTAYFFFSVLFESQRSQLKESYVVLQLLWLLAHLSRLLLLVSPCSWAKDQANRTGVLIGTLMNSVDDNILRKELEMFAMQLLHHRVTFSACGLIELDVPLVVTVLGSVTTYLVVLMQLKSSPS